MGHVKSWNGIQGSYQKAPSPDLETGHVIMQQILQSRSPGEDFLFCSEGAPGGTWVVAPLSWGLVIRGEVRGWNVYSPEMSSIFCVSEICFNSLNTVYVVFYSMA